MFTLVFLFTTKLYARINIFLYMAHKVECIDKYDSRFSYIICKNINKNLSSFCL